MTDSFNCANNLEYWAPTAMHLESSTQLVYRYVNLRGYSNTNHPLFYFLCMSEVTQNKKEVPLKNTTSKKETF